MTKDFLAKLSAIVARNNPSLAPFSHEKEAWRSYYEMMWSSVCLDPSKLRLVEDSFEKALLGSSRYKEISNSLGIPWQLIAGLHMRESSFNFACCLHNGEPLGQVTTLVPKGRGPFLSWEESAIDALKLKGLDQIADWSIASILAIAEAYNGLGYIKYHNDGEGPSLDTHSPYLWSCTTHYKKGKYASDGKFDPELVDKQVGIAALFLKFEEKGML
jgi:lysozyme family protein